MSTNPGDATPPTYAAGDIRQWLQRHINGYHAQHQSNADTVKSDDRYYTASLPALQRLADYVAELPDDDERLVALAAACQGHWNLNDVLMRSVGHLNLAMSGFGVSAVDPAAQSEEELVDQYTRLTLDQLRQTRPLS